MRAKCKADLKTILVSFNQVLSHLEGAQEADAVGSGAPNTAHSEV